MDIKPYLYVIPPNHIENAKQQMSLKSGALETPKPKNQASSGRPFIRPKLNINKPGDTYEQEADAMADKVMRMKTPGSPDGATKPGNDRYYDPFRPEVRDPFIKPANGGYDPFIKPANVGNDPFFKPANAVQRKHHGPDVSEDEQLHRKEISILRKWNGLEDKDEMLHRKEGKEIEDDKMLHRKERTGAETQADSGLDSYVNSPGTSGQPLPDASRQFFEPRFGHDFSGVRIHNDSIAAKSAQSINALAYTTGNNIVFNEGQYAPGSDSGNRLLAHELTHVVQQGAAIQPKSVDSVISTGSDFIQTQKATYTPLQEYKGNIVGFTEQELNDAIKTVYGELTATPHKDTDKEAHAIASTIFNRLFDIRKARKDYEPAPLKEENAKKKRDETEKVYNQIAKKPEPFIKQLLEQKKASNRKEAEAIYNKAKDNAHNEFLKARHEASIASNERIALLSTLEKVQNKAIPKEKQDKPITLSDIVSQNGAYEGTKKGISDFSAYPSMSPADQARNLQRYNAAKKAVIALASNASKLDLYRSFVGKKYRPDLKPRKGEVKIGENFFKNTL